MQANTVKNKLKLLIKNVDADKTGFVKHDVFFELLELHKVDLSKPAIAYLKQNFSKNQTINYKEAINQLTIDLKAAGGKDENASDAQMKWTVFGIQKKEDQRTSKIGDDSIS